VNDEHGGDDPVMDEAARKIDELDADTHGGLQRSHGRGQPAIAGIQHGLYAQGILPCDRCPLGEDCPHYRAGQRCALESEHIAHRRREIRETVAFDGQDPDLFSAQIESAIWAEVRIARAVRHMAAHGEFVGLDYTGVATQFPKLQARLDAALDSLDLSKAARAKLDAERHGTQPGYAQGVHALDAGATDVEFEAEDDDDSTGG